MRSPHSPPPSARSANRPRVPLVLLLCAGLALTSAASLVDAAPPSAAPAGPPEGPTDYLVGFHGKPPVGPGDRWHGGTVTRLNEALGFVVVHVERPADFEEKVRADARVRYHHVDVPTYSLLYTPNDPEFAFNQYGPQRIGAPAAWDTTLGSTTVRLCVTDTGLRATHQEVAGRVVAGTNTVANNANYTDMQGHGTHVTTIAAAITNNGVGIAGVAQSGILVAKVLDDAGSGTAASKASGITWCADQGAKVIVASWRHPDDSPAIRDAVDDAWGRGAVFVAASGNGQCDNCVEYPARYANAMAVSCTTSFNEECWFSSKGPEVDLAAPGYDIVAAGHTGDSALATKSGTSMSAPHVAGAAALYFAQQPTFTNRQVRDLLEKNAKDLGVPGVDNTYGRGLVQACALLDKWGNLTVGKQLTSCSGTYSLAHQTDGNVILYRGTAVMWAAGTSGTTTRLTIQDDGNLVLYNGGTAKWASGTAGYPGAYLRVEDTGRLAIYSASGALLWFRECGALAPNQYLSVGAGLPSCNGRYSLAHQTDGNVVAYDGSRSLWATGTSGTTTRLTMQADGNLVLYNGGTAKWASNTANNPGAKLKMDDDGRLSIYAASGARIWFRGCGVLASGESLPVGGSVKSCDGRDSFQHQTDGNLVLYRDGSPVWASGTSGPTTSLVMQDDGNLVLYDGGFAKWASGTAGYPGAYLSIQDGQGRILASNGALIRTL